MRSIQSKILMLGLMTGLAGLAAAQTGQYLPNNLASTATALEAHQVQGEYFGVAQNGDTLGAWVVANANNSYTVSLLPGGLVKIPGQTGGNWAGILRYSGTATWNSGTGAISINMASGYAVTGITGAGYQKTLTGTTNTASPFSLTRVHRRSPTLGLKPKASWGAAVSYFDSAAAAANPSAELAKWVQQNTTPQLNQGYLYRGVRTTTTHGAGFVHVEFMSPFRPSATGQDRGNAGVYLHSKYETQVLDSFGKALATNEMGAIYGTKSALINAALPPMNFQTYDIYFSPRTSGDNGTLPGAAVLTVYLNGVMVQDSTPAPTTTEAGLAGQQVNPGALYLQEHSNNVLFNNVWFVPVTAANHDALIAAIPYDSVLVQGGLPVSVHRPAQLRGGHDLEANRFFDVSGRRLPSAEAQRLPVVPIPSR
jgi:hypothetical protein